MVNITNGTYTYNVTRGAFESLYKGLGFHIVDEDGSVSVDDTTVTPEADPETADEPAQPELSEDEKWTEEIRKKPISSWSKQELKRYADIMKIDLTGVESVRAVRSRISATWE